MEENAIDCRVERVIEDPFSMIVMLRPANGTGRLRMELSKEAWGALDNPAALRIAVRPEQVMALTGDW